MNEVYTDLENTPDTLNATGDAAMRFNDGKRRWSLVDFKSLEPMVEVLEFGAEKYSEHNWKKGLKTTGICESMMRHLVAYLNGEDEDPESGISHIGHIQCNAMFLAYMNEKNEWDDRYTKITTKQSPNGMWEAHRKSDGDDGWKVFGETKEEALEFFRELDKSK